MEQRVDETQVYSVARICRAGTEAGVTYAPEVPCAPEALVADVVGKQVVLRAVRQGQRTRVELTLAEALAAAAACRAWQARRPCFTSSQLRVAAGPYRGLRVDPADPRAVVRRRAVPSRAVGPEVLLAAELRLAEGHEHAGALAGEVYLLPNDWTLEVTQDGAVLGRGAAQLCLRVDDAPFLVALAEVLRTAQPARPAQHPQPEQERHPSSSCAFAARAEPTARRSVHETTEEDPEDPFRL